MAKSTSDSAFPVATISLSDCQSQLAHLISRADSNWADPAWRQELETWRRNAALAALAGLQTQKSPSALEQVETLLSNLGYCGANDFAVSEPTLALARHYAAQGWPGVVAAALLAPAWQASFLPPLKDVPLWLMPLYASYVFAAPKIITANGMAQSYTHVYRVSLDSLLGLVEANRGSAAVKALLERFRPVEDCAITQLDPILHADIRRKRARLVAALNRQPPQPEPLMRERAERPLRLGIVARTIGDTPSAFSLLRLLERLPSSRFVATLLVAQATQSAAERQLQTRGAVLSTVGGDMEQVAQAIQESNLDVAIFLLDGSWLGNPIAELALRRLAPLQIVHDGSGLPSGFPHADLYTASPAATAARGEKGLRVAPAGLAGPGELHADPAPETWTRSTIGMDGAACVFGYFGELFRVTPEIVSVWARVLEACPASRLVIVAPATAGLRTDRFRTTLEVLFAAQGVAPERVAVFAEVELATHDVRQAALGAIDVLLDAVPGAAGDWACAALATHRPLVTWAQPAGAAAVLLRQAGVPELVAEDANAFVGVAARLGSDPEFRAGLTARLESASAPLLARHDSFVLGAAFAGLVESAYDRVLASRKAFRADPALLIAEAPPQVTALLEEATMFLELGSLADAEKRLRALLLSPEHAVTVRRQLAATLGRRGEHAEAADLLFSVVDLAPNDPTLWFELGLAFDQAGRTAHALQALEASIRLEPKRIEPWQKLAEIARQAGNDELRLEIEGVLRELGAPAAGAPSLEDLRATVSAV